MRSEHSIDLLYEHALDLIRLRAERAALEQRIGRRCEAVRRLLAAGSTRHLQQLSISVYRPSLRYDIVDAECVPERLWSRRPDRDRIAAAIRGGMNRVPGVVCRTVRPQVVVRELGGAQLDLPAEEG